MCLTIPMRILSIDGLVAHCEAKGTTRDASLLMMQDEPLQPGDYVLIHLGQVTQKVTAEEAAASWALYDELFARLDGTAE
ncbi:MAG: HypC/HybG/HupF family hydrogenase formation chaperone [Gammaproteobacteria bacterium]